MKKNDLIKDLIKRCETTNEHLRASVMIRGKSRGNNIPIILKRFRFYGVSDYEKYENEIQELLKVKDARFYVNPTVKSDRDIAYEMASRIPELLKNDNYKQAASLYDSSGDKNPGVRGKRLWIIDCDFKEEGTKFDEDLKDDIRIILGEHLRYINMTKNGVHLIVNPFNVQDTIQRIGEIGLFKEVDLKKNAMTLMFWNKGE